MIKVEVTEAFTLGKFNELKNIVRKSIDTPGQLNVGDTFECEKEMYEYLNGKNPKGKVVVKLLEVIPEEKEEEKIEKVETPKVEVLKKETKPKVTKLKTAIKRTMKK